MKTKKNIKKTNSVFKKIKKVLPKGETMAKVLCLVLAGLILLGMLTTLLY